MSADLIKQFPGLSRLEPAVQNVLTGKSMKTAKAAAGAAHPIGTMGEPDDIAWAVVWLASDEAKFVTGTEIVIDGGYAAR